MDQLRSWFCLGAILMVLAGALVGAQRGLNFGFPDLPDRAGTLDGETVRGRRLDAERAAMLECVTAKTEVTAAVLDGRLTLAEAAARFRDLDAKNPAFVRQAFLRGHPGQSDAERYAGAVMTYARSYLASFPGHDPEEVLPLETELARLLRGEGPPPAALPETP